MVEIANKKALEDKEAFTFRIPAHINDKIKNLSREIGISQNALILLFVYTGLEAFGNISHLQKAEFDRILAQISQ